jgi:general secretion pathway protein J
MHRHARRSHGHRLGLGFTLLELMVSVAIFAVVAAMAYTGLAQIARSSSAAQDALAGLLEQRRWMAQLDSDLEQVVARVSRGPYGETEAAMLGASSNLLFASRRLLADPGGLRSGLARISLERRGDTLVRSVRLRLDPGPLNERDEQVLVRGVRRFELRYLDARLEPQNQWPRIADPRLDSLPRAIEMLIEVEGIGVLRRVFEMPETAVDALP